MAKLILMHEGSREEIPLDKPTLLCGRLPECDLTLNSNMVSRRHAEFATAGERVHVKDLGSGNGTFVNGDRIGGDPVPLKDGDRVKLGPVLIQVECGSEGQTAATSSFAVGQPAAEATMVGLDEASDSEQMVRGTAGKAAGFGVLERNPAEKLRGVLQISRALTGSFDPDAILPKILDTLFDVFPAADRGFIFMRQTEGKDEGKIVQRACKFRRDEDDAFRMSRTIRDKVLNDREAVLSADASSDNRFTGSESLMGMSIRSMMCVPMLDREENAVGLINIDTTNQLQQFKEEDLDLMVAVAGQASMTYQSALLLSSYVQKQKQDGEMEIAQRAQHALLPESLPADGEYTIFASYDSAQAVGGDYYDSFTLEDGRVVIAFGDVAGKGVPASLVMSRLSSVVRSTTNHVDDVAQLMGEINDHMCARAVEGRFVTFIISVLDPKTNTLTYANAGHMPLMVRHADGSVDEYGEEEIGVPIGVMQGFPYEALTYEMQPGDAVVLYTDGVSEAMNPKDELYGTPELIEFVKKQPATNAEELGKAIREDVRRHADGREQNDDVTLMVVTRAG